MISNFIFKCLVIFLIFQGFTEKSLEFPFYIIPKYKSIFHKGKTPNTFKSFLEIPKIPVSLNDKERMCLELCFGTPKTCHLLTIHPQSFLIWVQDSRSNIKKVKNRYDPNLSTTAFINNTLIELKLEEGKNLKGYTTFDRIYTKNSFLFRGLFLSVVESNHYDDEGMIGMGYWGSHFEQRSSFINQLYFNELIYHRVFTQSFTNNDRGIITFGEIPKEIINNYKKYGRCPALNKEVNGKFYKNRKWECQVDGIYFGDIYNETYVLNLENARASFFSFRKRALIPREIFDFLEKNYFNELIQSRKCERALIGKYDTIKCKKQIIDGPKINFIFGDWIMSLPPDKLFTYKKDSDSYEFMFYHKKDFESWSLGRPVVRLFHMVYDYQNQEIGFFSEKNVLYINDMQPPQPPKIYEKLPDHGEPIDDNENNDPNKVQENEETIRQKKYRKTAKDIVDDIKKESGITEKTLPKTFETAIIIQKAFKAFIIIVIISIIIFLGFLYYRHRRKRQLINSDYFLKKAKELGENA